MRKAKLTIYYGPMYSGKSALLIKDILDNISTPKLVFKPSGDVRSTKVYTREGLEFEAISINDSTEIIKYIQPDWLEKIYIDELNFFDEGLVDVIEEILEKGVDVVCSGLDTDFRTEDFPVTKKIIERADIAVKLKAKCHQCGASSQWTARFIDGKPAPKDSQTILSDKAQDNVEYKTLCSECHNFVKGE